MSEPTRTAHRHFQGLTVQDKVVRLGRAEPLLPAPRTPLVRIHLLGSMRATTWLGQDVLPRSRKARALMAFLCMNAGAAVTRYRISGMLWDRVPESQANASFRQALRQLTVAMEPLADELILLSRDTIRLDASACWIDARAVLAPEPPLARGSRGDLAALCPGELLEGLDGISASFDQWLITERTRFTEHLRELLEAELRAAAGSGAEQRAAVARRVIGFDPTHEGASRALMRALADMGERAQALHEYERCRDALRAVLDVEPSSETRALHEALRAFNAPAVAVIRQGAGPPAPDSPRAPSMAGARARLRVKVLPFQAHAAHAERLALRLSQEIADGLARFRWFDVIAPTVFQRQGPGAGAVPGRDDLHYVVDGSLGGDELQMQLSVRLLDVADEPRPVWSDRFDLAAAMLDQVNALVVAPVVARIDPVILFIEGQEKRPRDLGADGLVLQAIPLMYSMEQDKYEEAGRLIGRALDADSANANVLAWAAYWQVWHVGQGWAHDPVAAFATAQDLAVRAIRIDPENAEALGIYAHICAFLDKDFESAMHYFDRALRYNPNLAFVWALSAPTCCYIGQPDLALQRLDRYRDLAPTDPLFPLWEYFYAIAYVFKGEYEKAVSIGRRAAKANPDFVNGYKPLIAALGHLGRREEAAPYIGKLLSLEPGFTVASFGRVYPFRNPADRERYMRGLALAGVPAG
jgi:DNA-binding SARP family transcriptional activator/TolB-like protein